MILTNNFIHQLSVILLFSLVSLVPSFGNPTADSLVQLATRTNDLDKKLEFYNDAFLELSSNNDSIILIYAQELIEYSNENNFIKGLALAQKAIAYHQLLNGNFHEAISIFRDAFQSFQSFNDYKAMLNINRNLGICFERVGLTDSIKYYANRGLSIAKESGGAEDLAKAHQHLGEYHANYERNLEKGFFHIDYAINLVKKEESKDFLAQLYYAKGSIKTRNGDFTGEKELLQAEKLAKEEKNNSLLIYIREALSHIYNVKGELSKSIEIISNNLEAAKKINDISRIAHAHSMLGSLYRNLYKEEKAIEHFQKAIEISKQTSFYPAMFTARFGLGQLHRQKKNFVKAQQLFEDIVNLADSTNNEADFYSVLPTLGQVYLDLKKFKKAKKSFEQVLENSKSAYYIQDANVGMGAYYLLQEKYDQAKPFLLKAYAFFQEQDDIFMRSYTANYLSQLTRATGNYQEALKWTDIHIEFSDSLRLDENRAKMTAERMSAEFENEKKLLALEQERKEEILRLENQQTRRAAAGIGMLALLILGFFWNVRRKNKTISIQNKQLEQLNNTKNQLFAIIGHDLKKPAISFRSIAKKVNYLIRKEDYKTLNKLGTQIEQNSLALYKLTDNLLNWALMQRDVMPYNPAVVSVSDIALDVQAIFLPPASEKNIEIDCNISEKLTAFADANALSTILTNLVDNAIKYTPNGGTVSINANLEDNNQVKIRVSDTGIGMEKTQMNDLFLLRNDKSQKGTSGEKGTGLGLHLVKELVELNKGVISSISELGKGTSFDVILPKMAV